MQSQFRKFWKNIIKKNESEKNKGRGIHAGRNHRETKRPDTEEPDIGTAAEEDGTVQVPAQMEEGKAAEPEKSMAEEPIKDTSAQSEDQIVHTITELENVVAERQEADREQASEKDAGIHAEEVQVGNEKESTDTDSEKPASVNEKESADSDSEKPASVNEKESADTDSEKPASVNEKESADTDSEKPASVNEKESTDSDSEKPVVLDQQESADPDLEKAASKTEEPAGRHQEPETIRQPEEYHAVPPEEAAAQKDGKRNRDTEEIQKDIKQKGDRRMDRDALFCDGTSSYVIPPEPGKGERIRLRFRTARGNADTVLLVADSGIYQMERVFPREAFDYYEIQWKLGEEPFTYCFEIHCGEEVCYYNRTGVSEDIKPHYAFQIVPGFSTPAWAKGAVMYQIFVDRFCNGDPENDVEDREYIYIGLPVERVRDWNEPPRAMDVRRFYGGDLQGVMEKLDYLQELGIEVIYFNPLFVSPSNHKYDIQDYDYIDPHVGKIVRDTKDPLPEGAENNVNAEMYQERVGNQENLEASNRLFIRLVEEIHRRGMRVILDGVFNHCGSFNKWMDRERIYESQPGYEKGAFVSKESPYHSFFHFFNDEDNAWPYNASYDGWWGNDTLPKMNYEDSEKLGNFIMEIGKKWVSPPYNVDGWRLDVAADLGHTNEYNHAFWKRFRKEIKSVRKDALILAEHYGDPTEWLQGDEWDSVMNYDAFMEPLTWFLTGMEKHSDEYREDLYGNADHFVNSMNHFMSCMLTPSLQTAMNELSNHDHSRFLTRTNHVVGRLDNRGHQAANEGVNCAVMSEAVAVQMTWVGAPTVYYGDEAGVCGFTDPDSRRTYPWGNENHRLLDFHREMIRIHKTEPVLRTGSLRMLYWDNQVLSYGRFQGDEQIIVIINNNENLREVTVPAWLAEVPRTGRMKRLIYSYEEGFTTRRDEYIIENGELVVNMGSHSALVAKTIKEEEQHC